MATPTKIKDLTQGRLYTVEEFDALGLPDELEDGSYYELVEGEVILVPPAGGEHGKIALRILKAIILFDPSEKLGCVYYPTRFQFGGFRAAPDLFFFNASRLPNLDRGAIKVPADLAVEVWSESDWGSAASRRIAYTKINTYLKNGFRLVWVINPKNKIVEVFHQGQSDAIKLNLGDVLEGGDVIPGFSMPVAELFS